jgi:hypothetical protein
MAIAALIIPRTWRPLRQADDVPLEATPKMSAWTRYGGTCWKLAVRNADRWAAHSGRRRRFAPQCRDYYRSLGQVIVSGAMSGLLTSSWIWAWAFSGMSRGFPWYSFPL